MSMVEEPACKRAQPVTRTKDCESMHKRICLLNATFERCRALKMNQNCWTTTLLHPFCFLCTPDWAAEIIIQDNEKNKWRGEIHRDCLVELVESFLLVLGQLAPHVAKINLVKTTKSNAASYQTMVLARLTIRTTMALIHVMSPHCFAVAISMTLATWFTAAAYSFVIRMFCLCTRNSILQNG